MITECWCEEILVRRRSLEAQKMIMSIATLLRHTTWKCGKIERRVVTYLQRRHQRIGSAQTPVEDMMHDFGLDGKQKSEFLEAIRRLEKRNIIRISWLKPKPASM